MPTGRWIRSTWAGLVLSNAAVRRTLGNVSIGNLVTGVVPDVERYLQLRAM